MEDVHLTPSEEKVCKLLQTGLTNQEMADHLFVSLHAIKKHLQNIYKKLGVTNRTSLLSFIMHKSLS
ncbi:helix-turn-helix transcriptional regulator [Pseudobacillus sp. FSL P4-0506]